jgi:fatty acid desaturase
MKNLRDTALPSPQEVSKLFGARSNIVGPLQLAVTWAAILLTILCAAHFRNWALYPVAALLLVGLQHRLFTLYHEGIHGCLVRNAELGHMLARFFAAYPSLSRYEGVRQRHIDHHLRAASTEDPERVSHCENWRQLAPLMFPIPFAVFRLAFGWAPFDAEFRLMMAERDNTPYPYSPGERTMISATMAGLVVVLALLCWAIGGNPAAALLYPAALILMTNPAMVLRQWVEHNNEDHRAADPRYFYVRSNAVERFFFSPMNFNFHGAHHYYPWIPHYNLPALHAYLAARDVQIHERPSYTGAIGRLLAGSARATV